ncbi:hypothetical protein C4D60_Mb06t06700 [Musa balbisiana]|uniref:Uncharacterized protein n=1 Tax=Musa balbisiana TaxID=52838 RepID=A0A4V4H3Q5_MUSBA|nr:hypothetical protein C4D60_Mb06t06700 [Musa balbisiana]
MQENGLLPAHDVSYFSYAYGAANFRRIDGESCKQACLKNCSFRAALFQYSGNVSDGNCFLQLQLFSLQNNRPSTSHYNSSAYIKVQNIVVSPASSNTKKRGVGIGISIGIIGAGLIASLIGGMIIGYVRRKRHQFPFAFFCNRSVPHPER